MTRRNDPRYSRLRPDLSGLAKACGRHLEKHLTAWLGTEGRTAELEMFRGLNERRT